MGRLASFAQFFIMLFEAGPDSLVVPCAFELSDFFVTCFPVNLVSSECACR